jgi:hypothetical protein
MLTCIKKIIFIIFLLLLLVSCAKQQQNFSTHQGDAFRVQKYSDVEYLHKNYKWLIQRKVPVKIKGRIKHYDEILGQWAFLIIDEEILFVNFAVETPNITLPEEPIRKEIILEGILVTDETVLNNFALWPYAYEIVTGNSAPEI